MTPLPNETKPTLASDENMPVTKPQLTRENSKRRNDQAGQQTDSEEILNKRPRHDDYVRCPATDFGCLSEIPVDKLHEHYQTQLHQECVLKAVTLFYKNSHGEAKNEDMVSSDDQDLSELFESVNLLTEGVSCLQDDNYQVHNNFVKLQCEISEQKTQVEQIQSSIEETRDLAQATQMNMNMLESEIENIKQKVEELKSQAFNDGTFIWKIDDVAKKLNDAISENQISIYSAPFYSSPTGYKMCLRLYFYGDGHARRTHLSLFFVLMRGEYDAILSWPFSHKITFCLYDQTGNQRHIIDSFRPDVKSTSFQRPRSNMNIASGIPKFCPIAIIQQNNNPYVRDDSMFIRCMIDFTSTPKKMIPFIFNINPGIPTIVQRTMIEAEMLRQKQLVEGEEIDSENSLVKKV